MTAKEKNIIKITAISVIAIGLIGSAGYFTYKSQIAFKNRMTALNSGLSNSASTAFDSEINNNNRPFVKDNKEVSSFCI